MEKQKGQGCPAPERLRDLLSGELQVAEQDALTQHIETCPSCQHTLDGWLSSPSIEGLAAAGKDSATQEAALRELMDNIKKRSVGDVTQAEPNSSVREEGLAFLSPSTRPGHLGRLGQYEILSILGKGGFGTVFKAFDEKLHRVVAIKVLAPELAASGTARKRFIREAQAAAAVKSDHIVAIYNVADEANPPYLGMELIDGISLEDRLKKEGSLELKEILRIGMQMAEGLAAAHKQGLIHRDIKPGNILLENGVQRVKITDFGLARAADDASVTQSGVIAGTPMFMSPEQAEGLALDHRSDLFSLGSVLYVMCTGRAPFRANTTMAVLKRVCDETPTPIREINPDVPDWLCAIVEKLQAKKADDRFGSAKEVAELLGKHLAEVQAHGRVEPRRGPVETPASTPKPRQLTLAAAIAIIAGSAVAVALIATLGVLFWPRGGEVVPPDNKDRIGKEKPPENDPEWVQLFNGKDFTGWSARPTEKWKVSGNTIIGEGPGSFLFSNKSYANFHCRMEVKINQNGHAGIGYRINGKDAYVSVTLGNKYTHKTGSLRKVVPSKPAQEESILVLQNEVLTQADAWFTIDVLVNDKKVVVKVDGKQTAEQMVDSLLPTGNITIGVHEAQTVLHIRNIQIKELPPTPPAEMQPFVVLAKAGRDESRHPTLAAAVAAAQSGDTIEIHGNDVISTVPVKIEGKPLVIRAAAGQRPILEFDKESLKKGGFLIETNGHLVIEGMEFRLMGPNPKMVHGLIRCADANLSMANCRLLSPESGMGVNIFGKSEITIRQCLFLSGDAGVVLIPVTGSLDLSECVFFTSEALSVQYWNGNRNANLVRVTAFHNTIQCWNSAIETRLTDNLPGNDNITWFRAERNVILSSDRKPTLFNVNQYNRSKLLSNVELEQWLKKATIWSDEQNLVPPEAFLLEHKVQFKSQATLAKNSAELRKLWKHDGKPTIHANAILERKDFPAYRSHPVWADLQPADFRLAKGSPGQGVLPGGKDLGADVDLVGPGAAYERWKKTPEYQEWRKKTEELMSAK